MEPKKPKDSSEPTATKKTLSNEEIFSWIKKTTSEGKEILKNKGQEEIGKFHKTLKSLVKAAKVAKKAYAKSFKQEREKE